MELQAFLVLCLGAAGAVAQNALTVKVANGTLQGGKCPLVDVNYFFSIPFATPPVGDLRFAPPQPYNQSYGGIRNATVPSTSCIQFVTEFSEKSATSEDCLFINVWAPANATSSSKLPVRIWLYGGDNAAGGVANPLYDGCFTSVDTVQVAINYRLGALGFLALESLSLSGNYGLQDQLLGLRWVRENIAAFGGDPTKVMLFGQSAGAQDTLVLSTLPDAASLFQSAILMSWANGLLPTLDGSKSANAAFVQALNCSVTDLACVRNASLASMVSVVSSGVNELGLTDLGLVIDGKVVTKQPLDAGIKVPTVVGSAVAEGTIFLLPTFISRLTSLNETDYDDFLTKEFGAAAAVQINKTYPVSSFASSDATAKAPVFYAMATVVTHSGFRCPARQALRSAAAGGVPVWTYSFGHAPTCPWYPAIPAQLLGLLGATHTTDIPFVMGQVDGLPRPGGNCSFTAAEKAISATMVAAWRSMAETRTPGGGWPQYSANTSMGINVGDTFAPGVVDYSMCDFWDRLAANGSLGTPSGTASPTASATATPTNTHANGALGSLLAAKSTAGIGILAIFVALLL